MARFNAVGDDQRYQRFHHRMGRVAGERLRHLTLPPSQLGVGDARIGDFIDHIINFTAESVKSGDGGTPLFGQKQEGVIKAAA